MQNQNQAPQPAQIMMQMIGSKLITKPLYIAAKLKVADLLTEGPVNIKELAQKTSTQEDSLYRVMRALASVGIFAESSTPRTFVNTPFSELLVDKPNSLRGMAVWLNDPKHDHIWEHLLYSVQTGKPAVEKSTGMKVFEFLKSDPALMEIFNQAMSSNAHNTHSAVLKAYDFSGIKTIYDIGGGHGHFMRQILEAHPKLNGGVFDLPEVIKGTEATIKKAKLESRYKAMGGSFFESVPEGADAHIMSFVLHDWNDAECLQILKNCSKSLPQGGKIHIVEHVISQGNEASVGKLLDIEMLVMTTGRERTISEYQELLDESGFRLTRLIPTPGPVSVILGEKL